jgi:flagellar hook assembly protein FlgD
MNKITTSLTAIALAAGFSLAAIAPASADQAAATRNQILGGLALIAGIATAVNVSNKNAAANTVQGYTANGDTVYNDGHVVTGNGQSYYPGNENQSISCSNGNCGIYNSNNGYSNNGYNGSYNNGYSNDRSNGGNNNGGNARWAQRGWQR